MSKEELSSEKRRREWCYDDEDDVIAWHGTGEHQGLKSGCWRSQAAGMVVVFLIIFISSLRSGMGHKHQESL